MNICFQAEHRKPMNRTGLKRLRKEGRLPGIIFGANTDNAMIHISMKEFQQWTRRGGTGVLDIRLGESGAIPVLLEDVQRDPVTREWLHADFLRVTTDEEVRTKLPVVYTGIAKGSKQGGSVQTQSAVVEVQALPGRLPTTITIDISELDIGESIQAGDIELPAGVSLVTAANSFLVSVVK
ncbi:MAG: ribosomal protein [Paenibacillus sp.]|nr:ribosomal protein [Paenibacillus sp.]